MKENMMDRCDRLLRSFCTHRPDRDNNNNEDQNKQKLFLKRCLL